MDAMAQANERFMACVKKRDREGFLKMYTDDAVLLLPGRPALLGRKGAELFFDSFDARGIAEVKLITEELEVLGATAWERGRSEGVRSDGSLVGRGKYLVVWKHSPQAGWRLHRDMVNADA